MYIMHKFQTNGSFSMYFTHFHSMIGRAWVGRA